MLKIKPCPECGSSSVFFLETQDGVTGKLQAGIICIACGSKIEREVTALGANYEEIIGEWNERDNK